MHKQKMAVLAAAGLGIIGLLMPWFKMYSGSVFGVTIPGVSINGFQAGFTGWMTFLGIVAAAGILFKESDKKAAIDSFSRKIVLAGGAAVVVFTLLAIIVGYRSGGVFVSFLAGAAIIAVPFVIKDSGEFEMPTKESITDDFNEIKDDFTGEDSNV